MAVPGNYRDNCISKASGLAGDQSVSPTREREREERDEGEGGKKKKKESATQ